MAYFGNTPITQNFTSGTDFDFGVRGTIHLQNDSDGKGDYIAKWEHPTLPKPTDEELA